MGQNRRKPDVAMPPRGRDVKALLRGWDQGLCLLPSLSPD